jgi:hypothetical protein
VAPKNLGVDIGHPGNGQSRMQVSYFEPQPSYAFLLLKFHDIYPPISTARRFAVSLRFSCASTGVQARHVAMPLSTTASAVNQIGRALGLNPPPEALYYCLNAS